MKKLLLLLIIFLTVATVNAQNSTASNTSFSLGAELAVPTGGFATIYSIGYGASAQANFGIGSGAAITAYAGYIHFSFKSIYGSGGQGHIPVLGGVEVNLSPTVFASGQLGATFYSTSGSSTAFTYAPGLGVRASKNISLLLKYVGESANGGSAGYVGLRAAYHF